MNLISLFSKTKVFIFTGLASLALTNVHASPECEHLKACSRKFCEIERQISIAKEKGNEYKTQGLETALKQAREHCSTASMRKDLEDDIAKDKQDLAEYRADLKEAEEYGRSDKIEKYRQKIEETTRDIQHHEQELKELE